jgi:hypothetical protein
MTVVHFAKVSTLYPWVVISSLAKWLEKPHFCHSYTSFGVWPRDHYMPLQRFTMGRMPGLAKLVHGTKAMLRFPRVIRGTMTPLAPCGPRRVTMPIFHSSEQGTLPTSSLISKQVVPYRTCGGICCPGVYTPKIRSLADSSMTIHNIWRNPTISTIPTHAQTTASILTMVTSHHGGWKTNTQNSTQAKLNIIKMERLVQHSRLHD